MCFISCVDVYKYLVIAIIGRWGIFVLFLSRCQSRSRPANVLVRSCVRVHHSIHCSTTQRQLGTGQGVVMPCSWEGNHRSSVALAMRHRRKCFIHRQAHGLDREMSTLRTLSCGVWPTYLYVLSSHSATSRFTIHSVLKPVLCCNWLLILCFNALMFHKVVWQKVWWHFYCRRYCKFTQQSIAREMLNIG